MSSKQKAATPASATTPPKTEAADGNEKSSLPVVADAKQGNLSVTSAEDFNSAMEQMSGAGLENVKAKDIIIPRLTILQALSPQLDRNKPEYFMKDAKRGDICDVGMKELFDGSIIFVPVYFMTQFLEWKPNRKGLAGIHNDPGIMGKTTEVVDQVTGARSNVLANGNLIIETAQFYGLNVTANYRFSFLPFAMTQLKKARLWNTYASSEKLQRKDGSEYTPPLFYRSYKLSSQPESNERGNWDGWLIERDLPINEMKGAEQKVFDLAMNLYNSIKSGSARGDVESMAQEASGGSRDNSVM